MRIARGSTFFLLAAGLFAAGCAHQAKQDVKVPAETAAADPGAGGTTTSPDRVNRSCGSASDCLSTEQCVNQLCVDGAKQPMDACASVRVHFSTDSSEIAEQDRGALERVATCLRASGSKQIVIEGNADERGTEEYNVSLGDRRARGVARYLEKLGVTPDQLKTVSFGKDNPLCAEHDEACWARNRRAGIKPANK